MLHARALALVAVALIGCSRDVQISTRIDHDGDGFTNTVDCDDNDPARYPGAIEACNGIDDDCDGIVDEEVPNQPVFYADADEDGYGDPDSAVILCDAPAGYVDRAGDCDDFDANAFPGNAEVCDGVDNDCDETVDEDFPGAQTHPFYRDADGDGFGDLDFETRACELPTGFSDQATDCDDYDATTWPGAPEVCDGADNDCDGDIDEEPVDGRWWYVDDDDDGWGGELVAPTWACDDPGGLHTLSADCDDADDTVHPLATEVCDGTDNDCNGLIDEGFSEGTSPWHPDADADGYGDMHTTVMSCGQPAGYLADASDCDDTDAAVSPDADEYCNGIDDNCDTVIDEASAVDGVTFYGDADGDGYTGATYTVSACAPPAGFTAGWTDCDDTSSATWPGAAEFCDGVDTDCDGTDDEADALDAPRWHYDADDDGHAGNLLTTRACAPPPRFEADVTDCNDANAAVNPDATERCNGFDDDCDGIADEGDSIDAVQWYLDVDGDGWGTDLQVLSACDADAPWVTELGDCNDADPNAFPGGLEVCNGRDDDCDTFADVGAQDAPTWHHDGDGDGFGGTTLTTVQCLAPDASWHLDGPDCDDAEVLTFPNAVERCDGEDNDCDGAIDEFPPPGFGQDAYTDGDADTYYGPSVPPIYACPGNLPPGVVLASGVSEVDCDDDDPAINPLGTEVCNGSDDDCDGTTDFTDSHLWIDGDGTLDLCDPDSHRQVRIPNPGPLDWDDQGTIEMFVYLASLPGNEHTLYVTADGFCNAHGDDERKLLWVRPDGALAVDVNYGSVPGALLLRSAPGTVPLGDWVHVAYAWDGLEGRLYLDGTLVAWGAAQGTPLNHGSAVYLGGAHLGTAGCDFDPIDGHLSQVRVSSIARYGGAAFTVSPNLLADGFTVALWPLDEGAGSVAGDDMGVHHGTVEAFVPDDGGCGPIVIEPCDTCWAELQCREDE